MKMHYPILISVLCLAAVPPAAALDPFRFASYYASHMVLQRGPQQAGLWGYAAEEDIGKSVMLTMIATGSMDTWKTKTFAGQVTAGPVAGEAVWSVALDPETSTTSFTITAVLSGHPDIELQDVLFGDVWVCSGQSNMQFGVGFMFGATEELAFASRQRDIRLFVAKQVTSEKPLYDLQSITTQWTLPSADVLDQGWNAFSAVCWLYGKQLQEELGYPIGLIDTTWGGTPVEAWSSVDALKACGVKSSTSDTRLLWRSEEKDPWSDTESPQGSHLLWNAMVHPFLNMTIKGAIWYQGEANAGGHGTNVYNCTFPSMIHDWRLKFQEATSSRNLQFPFGFMMLGPNRVGAEYVEGFSDIRWHQTADIGYVPNRHMPNTFMGNAMDLLDIEGSQGSIHPRDKKTTSARLAAAALKSVYSLPQYAMAEVPTPLGFTVDNQKKTLTIVYGKDILLNHRSLNGFEVCCAAEPSECHMSGRGHPWLATPLARATGAPTNSVVLSWHECGSTIAAVRYAWLETPCSYQYCALYNDWFNLPASPFIHHLPQTGDVIVHYAN